MNIKIKKVILILISLLCIAFLIYQIVNTYALFQNDVSGVIKLQNANWKITVNGIDVSSGIMQEFVIDEIQVEENTNVKNGKIAPGVNGSFGITIDPNDTQVSIRYDIKFEKTEMENKKIEIDKIEEILTHNTLIKTDENTYTGLIPLSKITQGESNEIKIYVNWTNDEANNELDTQIGTIINSKIHIPIAVTISQYLGEEIVPYNTGEIT